MKSHTNLNKSHKFFFLFWLSPILLTILCILSLTERKIYLENFRYNKNEYFLNKVKGKVIFILQNSPNINYIVSTQTGERILISAFDNSENKLFIGDDVLLKCKLKNVNFDNSYSLYLYNTYGITKLGYVLDIVDVDTSKGVFYKIIDGIFLFFSNIRYYIIELLQKNLSSPYDTVLLKLTLGYNKEEVEEIKSFFQDAGVAHVLVVSGLHVGFVYLFVYFLLKLFPLNYNFKVSLSLVFVFFYMFLTGTAIPVIRATILIFCLSISTFLERKNSSLHSLVLAAIIVLIIFPQSLFSASFQLSFGACFGIFYFYKKLKNLVNFAQNYFLIRYLIDLFLVTFSVQLMLTPLMIYYFNKITLVSFISNILIIPFTSIIVWLGFIYYILIFIFYNIPNFFWNILEVLLRLYIQLIEFFAKMPINVLYIPELNFTKVFIYYFIVLLFPVFLEIKKIKYYVVGIVSIIVIILLTDKFSKENLKLTFFDVGLGDSILVSLGTKEYLLIDTSGDEKMIKYKIAASIHKFTNKLDHLIITHPHYQHYAGVKYIIENFKVKNLYLSSYIPNYCDDYKEIIDIAKKKAINVTFVDSDKEIPFKDGMVYILTNRVESNTLDEETLADYNSLLLVLKYKNYQVILPNDGFCSVMDKKLKQFLKSQFNNDNFFVVQLPKHGKNLQEALCFNKIIKNYNNTKSIGLISTDKVNFDKNIFKFPIFSTDRYGTIELFFKSYKKLNKIKILGYKTAIEI